MVKDLEAVTYRSKYRAWQEKQRWDLAVVDQCEYRHRYMHIDVDDPGLIYRVESARKPNVWNWIMCMVGLGLTHRYEELCRDPAGLPEHFIVCVRGHHFRARKFVEECPLFEAQLRQRGTE